MFQSTMLVQKLSGITLLLLLCQHACFLSASGNAKRSVTCEGDSASLSCGSRFINVLFAKYGRTDCKTCSDGKPPVLLSNVHCSSETSLQMMATQCNGRKSCSVQAVNSVFNDPCVGTYKYLEVSYECLKPKQHVTCEGSRGDITCGKGVISVHNANYGRQNLATCPHKFATSTHCNSDQTACMRSRCNGKKSCHVLASNSEFSDPCVGVYKYLVVTYSCI
ncbi:L-rhamnose-binding lectin CSL3-like [Carassius carassius]|uniref:L-rhamnose-binding lectin CSL3-like n=1 Tax=Carassius carassius TaxID=217509 RepID=UPI0028689A7D|nr:L-rhamnose-binding lectin CSL3-like [Carassius carassius]XP_059354435.1 L-rhamnose-binding lectin CSL3-like [Carassius carassius]